MAPKFESRSSATKDLEMNDLRHLVDGGRYLEAKGWMLEKIGYLEGVVRELPKTEPETDTVTFADWQKLRRDIQGELEH